MLELFAIPVLSKAIDFLFDEGHKILQERRDRRQAVLKQAVSTSSSKNDLDVKKSDATSQEGKDVDTIERSFTP